MRVAELALLVGLVGCARPAPTDPLPLGADAASCGSCHEGHHDEWATSGHGTANRSPVFVAMLDEVEREWGEAARDTCVGCHDPGHGEDDAIGCLSCHAATGNHAERDGMLAVHTDRPLMGPLADPVASMAHATRSGELLASESLCGTCHEITGPRLVNEPTLTQFRASPAAAEGKSCIDCHAPAEAPRPLSNDSDVVRTPRSHRFVGFDPPWGADADTAADAAERTRALLADALTLRVTRDGDEVTVEVENVAAGHAVPTGAAFLRDLWVDVVVDGELRARAITIGDQPMLGDTAVPLLTRADRVEVGSLAPGETRRATFTTSGPVVAELFGRAIRPEALAAIGRDDLEAEMPTHAIHRAEWP
ncbi:MAG: hypothetical protein AB7S26_14675 [Sandaracinaceae bacterium]